MPGCQPIYSQECAWTGHSPSAAGGCYWRLPSSYLRRPPFAQLDGVTVVKPNGERAPNPRTAAARSDPSTFIANRPLHYSARSLQAGGHVWFVWFSARSDVEYVIPAVLFLDVFLRFTILRLKVTEKSAGKFPASFGKRNLDAADSFFAIVRSIVQVYWQILYIDTI